MARIVVVGAGGHGAEIAACIADMATRKQSLRLLGFLDDFSAPGLHQGLTVLGPLSAWRDAPEEFFYELRFITAVGDNGLRKTFVAKLDEALGGKLLPFTLIHDSSFIGSAVKIGEGTFVAPQAIITTRCNIGRHVILNVKASVSHDCEIGEFVNVNPGATICGNVRIGATAYIGAGATVINGVTIGEGAVIGAGATVVRDVPPRVTAVGVPARIIKYHG